MSVERQKLQSEGTKERINNSTNQRINESTTHLLICTNAAQNRTGLKSFDVGFGMERNHPDLRSEGKRNPDIFLRKTYGTPVGRKAEGKRKKGKGIVGYLVTPSVWLSVER